MAKKKWDESQVTRDENGRFVAQSIPMMGGAGLSPAAQRRQQQLMQQRQQLQQMNDPAGIRQGYQEMIYRQRSTVYGLTSSTRRRKGSSGLA
jgi:hypothetical protein